MDAARFDNLTRHIGSRASRRRLLGGLLGGLLTRLGPEAAGAVHNGCRHAGLACARDTQCCSGDCLGNSTCACTRASQCPPSSNPCKKAVCSDTGKCTFGNRARGAACDDGDPCTEIGSCDNAGQCVGGARRGDCDGDDVCETELTTDEANCGACGMACTTLDPDPAVCPNGGCEGNGGPLCFSEEGQHCECQNGSCCVVDAENQLRACPCLPSGFACNKLTCCEGAAPGSCVNGVCP